MIKLQNVTKIYQSKKENTHKALDDINLILPNTGLVFVIGKSGSGKSTLLNLIGGLDNITSGKIIVDGNDIAGFSENELASYRNNYMGFVFQDYHLLDELTVYENIVLSLNLNRIDDDNLVNGALEKVGLSGYENRYPQELSGGERQRVSIARALVKNPYVILADEPTGNLDNATATQIVELLKELSQERLILVVSHNTFDTFKFADRIIKLSEGKIIGDELRNPLYCDDLTITDGTMHYPVDKSLSESDVALINENLSAGKIKSVVTEKDKYLPGEKRIEDRTVEINNNNLSIKKIFGLCLTFLKSKIFRIVASSFMITAILVILSLSETIVTFDSGKIIKNEMAKMNQSSIVIEKILTPEQKAQNIPFDCVVEVEPTDLAKFKATGYPGKIYEVLSITVPVSNGMNYTGTKKNVIKEGVYVEESLGTMIVEEQFFIDKVGSYTLLCENSDIRPGGFYITDFLADAILLFNTHYAKKTYQDILGDYYYNNYSTKRGYINGIIKTGYREKYASLYNGSLKSKKVADLAQDPEYMRLVNDIYSFLGFSYSLNPNFVEDCIKHSELDIAYHHNMRIAGRPATYTDYKYVMTGSLNYHPDLKDNEVIFSIKKYNELFGTNYTEETSDTFVPHTVTVELYKFYDPNFKNKIDQKEVYIKGLYTNEGAMFTSQEVYEFFNAHSIFTKGYYFDGVGQLESIISKVDELNFEHKMLAVDAIHTMTLAVDVFVPIFRLIAIVLCVGIVLILFSFSTKMIKDKMHDIGILKALGCKNGIVGFVFGLQIALIAICTIIMSILGYLVFIGLANDILIKSLKILAPSHIMLNLDFLTFKMGIALMNSALIIILAIISFIIPMIKISRIKPVQIIKTKE